MGRGSSHSSPKGGGGGGAKKKGNEENGIELYRQFVEGESDVIHNLLGYDPIMQGLVDPDSQATRDLETVFKPAESDIEVYKGFVASPEDIDMIRNGTFKNPTISSTTVSKSTAQEYADRAFDIGEEYTPVRMDITIKKGTKVADARKILGSGGMKGFEKEITVWKGTTWRFGKLRPDGNDGYIVNVTVN